MNHYLFICLFKLLPLSSTLESLISHSQSKTEKQYIIIQKMESWLSVKIMKLCYTQGRGFDGLISVTIVWRGSGLFLSYFEFASGDVLKVSVFRVTALPGGTRQLACVHRSSPSTEMRLCESQSTAKDIAALYVWNGEK